MAVELSDTSLDLLNEYGPKYLTKNELYEFYHAVLDDPNTGWSNVGELTAWLEEQGVDTMSYLKGNIIPVAYCFKQQIPKSLVYNNTVRFPSNIDYIDLRAFNGSYITKGTPMSVDLRGISRVGSRAFNHSNTNSIWLDEDVLVGNYAFARCNIETIYVPKGVGETYDEWWDWCVDRNDPRNTISWMAGKRDVVFKEY